MSVVSVTNVILDMWRDGWSTATPYVFDNEELNRQVAAWARLSIRDLAGGQYTMGKTGNRKFRRRGQVIAQAFTETGIGTAKCLRLAEQARDIYEGKRVNDILFLDGDIQRVGVPKGDRYYQVVMFCPFWYTVTK